MRGMIIAALIGQSIDILLLVVGVLGALAFLLFKVIVPGSKKITVFNEDFAPNVQYMPLLAKLNEILTIIEDVADQTKSDSGSTLKDDLLLLRGYAEENRQAAAEAKAAVVEARAIAEGFAQANAAGIKALEILVGTIKEHAQDDRDLARRDRDLARDALQRMVALAESAARTEESGARQEAGAVLAAESRARTEAAGERIEAASAVVAEDLADAKRRADDVHSAEPPGSAADAASQSPDGE
jgi:hypothetical protein